MTITRLNPIRKTSVINVGNVTIANNGYKDLTSNVPSDVRTAVANGAQTMFAQIEAWTSNTGAFSIAWLGNGELYAFGTPGVAVVNLRLRLFYML